MDARETLAALVARFDPEAFDAPAGRARIRLAVTRGEALDAEVRGGSARLVPARRAAPDAMLEADARTWRAVHRDLAGGMAAFRAGRLTVRHNLHLGVGFLAATSGVTDPGKLRFRGVRTRLGRLSTLEAGVGEPVVMLHGLGGTKASFMPTVAALAPAGFRTIAVDLPGFGDSDKPVPAAYDAAFFARWTVALLDALELERAHVLGHSMGGRVALEVGMRHPDRCLTLSLLTPSMAWRGERRWASALRLVRPELGLLQPTPRPVVEGFVRRMIRGGDSRWVTAGVDEFLRSFLTPRGRVAFYAAARQIYLEDGAGKDGFWTRLESCAPRSLFLWGRQDGLVPIAFARHVERALPSSRHVAVDSGHVPQLERPKETHAALLRFLRAEGREHGGRARRASRARADRAP
jgi:pimeloyl-ACP methyl ester carboxylesterase